MLEGDNDSNDKSDIVFVSKLCKPKPRQMNTNVILYQTDDDQNDKSGLGWETEREASVSVIG